MSLACSRVGSDEEEEPEWLHLAECPAEVYWRQQTQDAEEPRPLRQDIAEEVRNLGLRLADFPRGKVRLPVLGAVFLLTSFYEGLLHENLCAAKLGVTAKCC